MAYPPYSLLVCIINQDFIHPRTKRNTGSDLAICRSPIEKTLIIKGVDMHPHLFYDIIFSSVSYGHELGLNGKKYNVKPLNWN